MLAWVLLARALGEADFGVVSWCMAIVAYASIPADGGLAAYGARELARNPTTAAVPAIRRLRLLLSCGVFLVVLVVSRPLVDPDRWLVLICAAAWVIPASLNPEWILQGSHRVAAIGALRLALGIAFLLSTGLWAAIATREPAGGSLLRAASEATVISVALVIGWRRMNRSVAPTASISSLLRGSLPLAGASMLTALYAANFDILVLGQTRSNAEAGLYAAAFRLYLMLAVLPKLLLVPAYPRFAASAEVPGSLQTEIDRFASQSLKFGLPVILLTWLLAPELIHVIYGPAYAAAAPVLQLLAVAALALLLNAPFPSVLLAAGKNRPALLAFASALAVGVGINLLATPRWGMPAAAIAVIAAESVVLLMTWRFCVRHLGVSFSRTSVQQGLCGIAALLAALAARSACAAMHLNPLACVVFVSLVALAAWAATLWLQHGLQTRETRS